MTCMTCNESLSMANLTVHDGRYWCPRCLYNRAMDQLSNPKPEGPAHGLVVVEMGKRAGRRIGRG